LGAGVNALGDFPEQVARTKERLETLNPEFVSRAIAQLMIMPDYEASASDSLGAAIAVLGVGSRRPEGEGRGLWLVVPPAHGPSP